MKSFLLIAVLLSTSAFAKTNITDGIKALLPSGEYEGRNVAGKCFVSVLTSTESASVSIRTDSAYDGFTILNNSSSYRVNDLTGEISAKITANLPRYYNGGTKSLYVKPFDTDEIEFSISTILLDHRGNDASTYLNCTVSL